MKKSVDTQYTTFFDEGAGRFLSYTRDRYGNAAEPRAIRRVRRVSALTLGTPGKSYTDAECPWTNSTVVIDIDARDNSTHPRAAQRDSYNKVFPPMDLYGAVVWPDASAQVYWAFPWRFWHFEKGGGPGTYDVALMSSRDGLNFRYVDDRRPFVRTGREGTPGSSRVRVLPSPVVINDTMFVYIWLTNLAEMKGPDDGYNATTDRRPIESALGVVRMRKDGFVALASPTYGEEALVTTVPIVAGGELWVNVDCLNGELRVELRSADTGEALPGFSLNESVPLSANSVAKRVVWAGGDGTVRPGTPLVIAFHLLEARLYSYQFRQRGAANSSKTDDSAAAGAAAYPEPPLVPPRKHTNELMDTLMDEFSELNDARRATVTQLGTDRQKWAERQKLTAGHLAELFSPLPSSSGGTAPNMTVTGSIHHESGFTMHKIIYQTRPGLFVTGSLWVPDGLEGSGRKAPAVMLTSGHTHDAWRCTGAALGDCTGPLDNCTAPDSNAGGGGCPVTGGKCHGPKSKLGPFPANPGGYQLVLWNLVHKGFVALAFE